LASGWKVGFANGVAAIESGARKEMIEIRRRRRVMAGNIQILSRLDEVWPDLSRWDRFAFASHKLMRWLAPLFLFAALVAAAAEIAAARGPLPVALAWCFLLGVPHARYFLLMNAALVAGLIRDRSSGMWEPERG
jgi:hypothetical protein